MAPTYFLFSAAILILYLHNQLYFGEDTSTVIYHVWAMLCYFTPILGAIIADTWLGRFKYVPFPICRLLEMHSYLYLEVLIFQCLENLLFINVLQLDSSQNV